VGLDRVLGDRELTEAFRKVGKRNFVRVRRRKIRSLGLGALVPVSVKGTYLCVEDGVVQFESPALRYAPSEPSFKLPWKGLTGPSRKDGLEGPAGKLPIAER
jgi:hypothetical protein